MNTYSQNPENLYLLEPEEDLRGPLRVIKIIKDRPLNGMWLDKTTKAGDLFGPDATECFFTKTEHKGTFRTKNKVTLLGGSISEGRRPSFQAPVCCPTGVYRPVFSRLCSCRMLSGFQAERCTRLPGGLINPLMAWGLLSHSSREVGCTEKFMIKFPGETDLILRTAAWTLTEFSTF